MNMSSSQKSIVENSSNYFLYQAAINNFFGEIPNFFLKGNKIASIGSTLNEGNVNLESGKSYYMDVNFIKKSQCYYDGNDSAGSDFCRGGH